MAPFARHCFVVATTLLLTLGRVLALPGFSPTFEEHNGYYVWNSAGYTVRLDAGSTVTITSPDGKAISIQVVEASQRVLPVGEQPAFKTIRYSGGTVSSSPTFGRVRYREIYPGIDLLFLSKQGHMEYNFELAPGADPDRIRLRYSGAKVHLAGNGGLELDGRGVTLGQTRPVATQAADTGTQRIACGYAVSRSREVKFRIGKYNPGLPLLIDPVFNFSTFLGGPAFDEANAAVADAQGNLYLAGDTSSQAITGGGSSRRPSQDAFVAKLDSTGTQLVWVVYLGGSQYDSATGIALDPAGGVYITGVTTSSDFPVSTNAFARQNSGGFDAFAVKLSPSGAVVYSTYLGGPGNDQAFAIAVDAAGSAYIAGQAAASFPVTSGALQRTQAGGQTDCFISKLGPAGDSLVYSTYLGGSSEDFCRGIAVDGSGNAYVAGTTFSTRFPAPAAVLGPGGLGDAFAAKINPSGSTLVYLTLFGGTNYDAANAIAVDSAGAAYIAGQTNSVNFPATTGAFQSSFSAFDYHAFAAKLTPDGSGLAYATLLGGSATQNATAVAVDQAGRAVLAGFTNSVDFPTMDPLQPANQGGTDGFVTVIGPSGNSIVFSTYLGGVGDDRAAAVATLPGNRIFVAGTTTSNNFPVFSANQRTLSGSNDAFATQLTYGGGLVFVPLAPCRIVDTRETSFGAQFGAPFLPGGSTRTFNLPSSACAIPATAGAYSLNMTAVPRRNQLQFLSAWPAGQKFPGSSTLNSFDGRVVANAAIVPAGVNGAINVFVSEDSEVVIDINGYFDSQTNPQGLAFYSKTPCRIADTRPDQRFGAPFGAPFLAGSASRNFPLLSSVCGIPPTAQAYSLNVTAIPRLGTLVFLSIWRSGQPFPGVSTLNSFSGTVVANAAVVPGGSDGSIEALASQDADFIIDIDGYFAPPAPGGLSFYAITPCRVADTRADQSLPPPFGPPNIPGGGIRSFPILSSSCGIPSTAQAYVLNVTALPSSVLGFLTLWPAGQPQPLASTLNSYTGTVVANAAIVPAGAGGAVSFYASGATDLIVDISGYFAP